MHAYLVSKIYMTYDTPLDGLCITDDRKKALEAMFCRHFEIVILKHPAPEAFEAAMYELMGPARPSAFMGALKVDSIFDFMETIENTAKPGVNFCRENMKMLNAGIERHLSGADQLFYDVNRSFSVFDCYESPIDNSRSVSRFHIDEQDYRIDGRIPQRLVVTLYGGGTEIISAAVYDSIGELQKNSLLRSFTDEDEARILDDNIIAARPGDLVFISQVPHRHLYHAASCAVEKPRRALVMTPLS